MEQHNHTVRAILAVAAIFAGTLAVAQSATASDRLRWPSHTNLPPPKSQVAIGPRWRDIPSPHMQAPMAHSAERYDPIYQPRASSSYVCKQGEACVKCVANCDGEPAVVVQKLSTDRMKASRDPSGAPEPVIEQGRWNAIRCYDGGGCSASNVIAPRRVHRSYDVTITYIRRNF